MRGAGMGAVRGSPATHSRCAELPHRLAKCARFAVRLVGNGSSTWRHKKWQMELAAAQAKCLILSL